jgi:hypothetical protein
MTDSWGYVRRRVLDEIRLARVRLAQGPAGDQAAPINDRASAGPTTRS